MKNKIKVLVTGCCGFIGSHAVDFLLRKGLEVIGIDNFSTGKKEFIKSALKNKKFKFYKLDLLKKNFDHLFTGIDIVFHFSANADVRYGLEQRNRDILQNIIVTHRVLEAMKKKKLLKLFLLLVDLFTENQINFQQKKHVIFLYKHLYMGHPNFLQRH